MITDTDGVFNLNFGPNAMGKPHAKQNNSSSKYLARLPTLELCDEQSQLLRILFQLIANFRGNQCPDGNRHCERFEFFRGNTVLRAYLYRTLLYLG